MKQKLLFLFATILILASINQAQYRRIVLLEEATNASCSPCAANNPTLQSFFKNNFGGVISVRYHASWPGSDPMYSANSSESSARISYYGISGVPNYTIDGSNKGIPGNFDAMQSQMQERLAMSSPVKIDVDQEVTGDSVITNITITAGTDVTQTILKLRAAVIERMITYSSAPGSNGEKVFPDVFRKMFTSTNGESIAQINNGDVLNFRYSVPLDGNWNAEDLAVVAWLQSDATKEVINSNISMNTFVIETPQASDKFMSYNESYTKEMVVLNSNSNQLNVKVYISEQLLPDDWSVSFTNNGNEVDTLTASISPGDSLEFQLMVTSGSESKYARIDLFVENTDDPYQYGFATYIFGTIKGGNLLFVDADGGENYETSFFEAFDSAKVDYTYLTQVSSQNLYKETSPNEFDAMIWNVSWSFPACEVATAEFLMNYLDNGGNLYIAGQDIGWDIYDSDGSSRSTEARSFYGDYLDANYVSDNSNKYSMVGVAGDPIGEGLSFNIGSVYSRYPEVITSNSGSGVLFLEYTGTSKFGAIRYDGVTFKTVYTGFGIEQITSTLTRNALVKNILGWFGLVTDVESNEDNVEYSFELSQNYPNPFNPSTVINYQIKNQSKVELKVFDVLGREITKLVDGLQEAGKHSVDFNASNLSSGIYFYRLKTDNFTSTKKMMLVR